MQSTKSSGQGRQPASSWPIASQRSHALNESSCWKVRLPLLALTLPLLTTFLSMQMVTLWSRERTGNWYVLSDAFASLLIPYLRPIGEQGGLALPGAHGRPAECRGR